ncbi:unnamed protein product [Rotaria sordida]|uniref:Peptidase M12B domain-containing protein n=1 Tax=Rotaria sordida TaxID=392033 RepID=A0A813Q7X0_9BILA|nr:unnamed protein product [Rotaria sordida]CAF3554512.1 unnamed protein product [Rotaria sordida]
MCIWIINYQAGEIVYQPIIQLFGFDNIYHETILVNNKYQWPIVQGLFKIYIELNPGENIIQLSTLTSELSFTLIYSPLKTTNITLRLIYVSFSDTVDHDIENICKKFIFLTKLVRCTFDEILYKQMGYKRSLLFDIERKIHHISMLKKDFEDKITGNDIFKEIYCQIYKTDLVQDGSVKLIIKSSISSSLTFAYTFNNMIVLNLPKEFNYLPISFNEFYENLNTNKIESLFYSIGAYLHELGHLFGLDHGNHQDLTIMSSSKGYIDSGKDFFLISPRLCSIIYNQQCSCYKKPILNISCSYSNGVLSKHSLNFKCLCKSDIHCQFALKFNHYKYNEKPKQCICNGQFQFDINHCHQLMVQFDERN